MLDPSLSFDRFVVGSSNELAATAARRCAESPGAVYNPLLICGGSGSGKTHLLHAIGGYATALEPDIAVHLATADQIAQRVAQGLASGDLSPFIESLTGLDLLLIDEVERLSGMERTQEELADIADLMANEGRQVVMTSVLSPADLPGFVPSFKRLLQRGVAVEIPVPDEPTRRTLADRFARERGTTLGEDVLRALGSRRYADVPSLASTVERLLLLAKSEGRPPRPADVSSVAGPDNPVEAPADEFGTFLDDVSRTLAAVVETAPWRRRVAETILRWEGEGIRTLRLEEALLTDAPADIDTLLDTFSRDATRLVQIRAELREYGIEDLPDNPTDLAGAESLLNAVRIARNGADAALQTRVAAAPVSDPWFLNREKVVLDWVDLDGRLVEDPR